MERQKERYRNRTASRGWGCFFWGVNSKDVQNIFEGWSACNDDVCSIEKLKKVHFSGGVGWGDRTVLAIRPPLRKRGERQKETTIDFREKG